MLAALAFGGGADAALRSADPGAVVRFGLPSQAAVQPRRAGTLGGLVLACFALDSKQPEYGRALDVAAASAGVWTVASAVTAFFTFLSARRSSLDDRFGDIFGQYLTTTENGRPG